MPIHADEIVCQPCGETFNVDDEQPVDHPEKGFICQDCADDLERAERPLSEVQKLDLEPDPDDDEQPDADPDSEADDPPAEKPKRRSRGKAKS